MRKSKKSTFFSIFSSSEADFSKEFLTKVLIEGTKNFFFKKLKYYIKILFPTDFLMVLAHSKLKGFVHTTKIEKQVRFGIYLIFGAFTASQSSF